jgi:hypothetical protein
MAESKPAKKKQQRRKKKPTHTKAFTQAQADGEADYELLGEMTVAEREELGVDQAEFDQMAAEAGTEVDDEALETEELTEDQALDGPADELDAVLEEELPPAPAYAKAASDEPELASGEDLAAALAANANEEPAPPIVDVLTDPASQPVSPMAEAELAEILSFISDFGEVTVRQFRERFQKDHTAVYQLRMLVDQDILSERWFESKGRFSLSDIGRSMLQRLSSS